MSRQQGLLLGIVVFLSVSFLIGCGGNAPTAISEAPAATSISEQVAATPTPEPPTSTPKPPTLTPTPVPPTPTPIPPTATPTPEPPTATPTNTSIPPTPTPVPPADTPTPKIVQPQPGSILSGHVEDNENVSGAIVKLELSADSDSISMIIIGLTGPGKCGDVTLGEGSMMNSFISGPFPITEGGFDISLPNEGELKGQFTSPTEANGTITVMGLQYVSSCKFGPLNWSAKAEE